MLCTSLGQCFIYFFYVWWGFCFIVQNMTNNIKNIKSRSNHTAHVSRESFKLLYQTSMSRICMVFFCPVGQELMIKNIFCCCCSKLKLLPITFLSSFRLFCCNFTSSPDNFQLYFTNKTIFLPFSKKASRMEKMQIYRGWQMFFPGSLILTVSPKFKLRSQRYGNTFKLLSINFIYKTPETSTLNWQNKYMRWRDALKREKVVFEWKQKKI